MSSPDPSYDSFAFDPDDDQWNPYDDSSQRQTQTNEETNELKFCQLSNWDSKKTYDDSYIRYSIEWKVTVNNRAIMPKDTEQDIVLAPAAYWQHFLQPKLDDSLRNMNRSLKSDFTSVVVSVTQRKEPDLTKRFNNTSIDWAVIESQLLAWGELYRAVEIAREIPELACRTNARDDHSLVCLARSQSELKTAIAKDGCCDRQLLPIQPRFVANIYTHFLGDSLVPPVMADPPRTHKDYQIGIICALATEKAAMVAMLHETHPRLRKENGDENEYTLGRIGVHNVVIACLQAGLMGNGPAAIVANNMQRSFPIKFGLMVGVGGGVWSQKDDIRLGDVVVSQPTGTHGGVVQWDFGKTGKCGKFQRIGSLDKPPAVLLHALQALKTFDLTDGVHIEGSLSLMVRNKPRMSEVYRHQGADRDQLFKATYDHEGDETCEKCNPRLMVQRPVRNDSTPKIHYGNIASGNEVMKHGITRDKIAKEEGVICFEMEAAGLMDSFRCLVIRGICDYADSHKNKIWQPYAAATAAAFARELLVFIDEQEVIKAPPPPKPLTVLPFGRNRDFVGRKSQLIRLITILHTGHTGEDCQRAALVGLGGTGKTQVALECAFQIRTISPECSVFWVRASDATSFDNAYRDIGQQLKIPGLDNDKADVKRLVKTRLSQESVGRWLMILDNADDFELLYKKSNDNNESHALHEYLPFSPLGAILFTTRDREAATRYAGSDVIDIKEMDDAESMELLQRSLQNKQLIEDKGSTKKLLKLLVNLPLAIMQVVAYINTKSTTIAEYLRIYDESSDNVIKLLSKDFEDRRRYPDMKNPIATTWLISFKQIQVRDALAANYMAFISCINEQDIPRDLLPPASEFAKTEAIGTLKAFGFIKERLGRTSYDMHRLVHIAMQNWLKLEDEWTNWNQKTIKQIADVFPWPSHENRAVWTMYLPHAQCTIVTFRKVPSGVEELPWRLLDSVGECLSITDNYTEAGEVHRQALLLKQKVLGVEHRDTLGSINNLAIVLTIQGTYAEAEAMHRRLLQLRQKVLGAEHRDTLGSINNLAIVLRRQGKYAEAEGMNRRLLQLRQKVLGAEHPDTLGSINNLAVTLRNQGKYAEAEAMHRHALQIRKVLDAEHPETLNSINNLAVVLREQGKYAEAEAMHRQALQLREKVLGAEHSETLDSINDLAVVLRNQGKYSEAEAMHQQALQLREKVLGAEHPDTLDSLNDLAKALRSQGKHAAAEQMHRQALQLREKVLGDEHPDTLASKNNLAKALNSQGKHAETEERCNK